LPKVEEKSLKHKTKEKPFDFDTPICAHTLQKPHNNSTPPRIPYNQCKNSSISTKKPYKNSIYNQCKNSSISTKKPNTNSINHISPKQSWSLNVNTNQRKSKLSKSSSSPKISYITQAIFPLQSFIQIIHQYNPDNIELQNKIDPIPLSIPQMYNNPINPPSCPAKQTNHNPEMLNK